MNGGDLVAGAKTQQPKERKNGWTESCNASIKFEKFAEISGILYNYIVKVRNAINVADISTDMKPGIAAEEPNKRKDFFLNGFTSRRMGIIASRG